MHIAHYNHESKRDPHLLRNHVAGMLKLIRQFDLSFDRYGMTESSVILHDVGKKSNRFQCYVNNPNGKRGTVKHALGGAYALYNQKIKEIDKVTNYFAELVSLVVACHHSGLHNFDKQFIDKLKYSNLPEELINVDNLAVNEVLTILGGESGYELNHKYDKQQFKLYMSLLVRFVFSALIDADYLDTSAYFNQQKSLSEISSYPNFSYFQVLLQSHVKKLNRESEDNFINDLRSQLQKDSLKAGCIEDTFFVLDAPTGTGKTLAGLQFALEHAVKFNKNRIITALPLINLTEEVSDLYRKVFGKKYITEDHSGMTVKDEDPLKYFVSERWSYPFVVTTTVQLFESLFQHSPNKLRKLHHLYNSIIIIDEFHQLPLNVLNPIMKALDMLQQEFNVTVLMMSATPFPLLKSKAFKKMNLISSPTYILPEQQLFECLPKRVTYRYAGGDLTISNIVETLTKESIVLLIVNTRKQAQQLFYALKDANHHFDAIYHLSTTMCSHHRRQVIHDIKNIRETDQDKQIAVISTSILEAGVDISFPVVYRMMAPLDSIIQSAGRCNRHHEVDMGQLILFNLKDTKIFDEEFKAGIAIVEELIKSRGLEGFVSELSFTRYYKRMLCNVDLNENEIKEYLMFRRVSRAFKMIKDTRETVLCPMADGFKEEWLTEKRSRVWWKKIKPFIVPITKSLCSTKVSGDLQIWEGEYDSEVGIQL